MARILVVDDDPMMLELYREILAAAGHEVSIAENGTQALARTDDERDQPELIVVDLMMPTLNGHEFVREVGRSARQDAGDRRVEPLDRRVGRTCRC